MDETLYSGHIRIGDYTNQRSTPSGLMKRTSQAPALRKSLPSRRQKMESRTHAGACPLCLGQPGWKDPGCVARMCQWQPRCAVGDVRGRRCAPWPQETHNHPPWSRLIAAGACPPEVVAACSGEDGAEHSRSLSASCVQTEPAEVAPCPVRTVAGRSDHQQSHTAHWLHTLAGRIFEERATTRSGRQPVKCRSTVSLLPLVRTCERGPIAGKDCRTFLLNSAQLSALKENKQG